MVTTENDPSIMSVSGHASGISVRTVRSIKSHGIDVGDPVTNVPIARVVMVGAKGTGKTKILECLYGILAEAEDAGSLSINRSCKCLNTELTVPKNFEIQAIVDID